MKAEAIFYKLSFFVKDFKWTGIFKRIYFNPEQFNISAEYVDDNVHVRLNGGCNYMIHKHEERNSKVESFIQLLKNNVRSTSGDYLRFKKYTEWKDIKKKSVKNFLIENYVIETYRGTMNAEEIRKILCQVKANVYLKKLTIDYQDNRIKNINGFSRATHL